MTEITHRNLRVKQIAITVSPSYQKHIIALREDGQIYIYNMGSSNWHELPKVPDMTDQEFYEYCQAAFRDRDIT